MSGSQLAKFKKKKWSFNVQLRLGQPTRLPVMDAENDDGDDNDDNGEEERRRRTTTIGTTTTTVSVPKIAASAAENKT
jgi:hypothetical protein